MGEMDERKEIVSVFSPSKKLSSPDGLPDYLREGLDIVFVGDNPGIQSAKSSSWYAHNTNHFWPLLHKSGVTKKQLGPTTDYQVLDEKIGLTCLHSKSTRTVDDVAKEDWVKGYSLLKEKLSKFKPKAICFNGKGIYQTITGKKNCSNGLQPPLVLGATKIVCFVMPSSSARVKAYTFEEKVGVLKGLIKIVRRI